MARYTGSSITQLQCQHLSHGMELDMPEVTCMKWTECGSSPLNATSSRWYAMSDNGDCTKVPELARLPTTVLAYDSAASCL